MLNENNTRLILDFIGAISVLSGPWWLPGIVIVLLSLRFRAWEAIIIGLLMDLLWLPTAGHYPWYFIASIAIVWIFEPLRKELLLG